MDPRSDRHGNGGLPTDRGRHRGSRRLGEGGIGLPDAGMSPAVGPRMRGGRLRRAWERGQSGIIRVALLALAVWALYHLVGSRSGVLQLYSLSRTEAALQTRYAQMQLEYNEVIEELNEDPRLRMERVMREKYQRSLPGEIIYRIERRGRGDSTGPILQPEGGAGPGRVPGTDGPPRTGVE